MEEKKNILLISNGHGEDIIGANILEELTSQIYPESEGEIGIKVLPVVGEGKAYQKLPVELVGPGRVLPSGGFARNSLKNFLADLREGLLGLTLGQIRTMKRLKPEVDLVVVVGDIYILLLAGLFTGKKTVFLPTAKSEYISGHYRVEKYIMRKMARIVLPRDEKTADNLRKAGVNARFVGNAMMDSFSIKDADFGLDPDARIAGILPGSREEAYDNMIKILAVIEEIEALKDDKLEYLTALVGSLSLEKLLIEGKRLGWEAVEPLTGQKEAGVYSILRSPSTRSRVHLIYHHFGDILEQAEIFIGLAGTANEQAAGLGKPVVTFPGQGSQFTEGFARAQKQLLGESVALVENGRADQVASRIVEILEDEALYNRMSRTGKERMGEAGGIKRMAGVIEDQIER